MTPTGISLLTSLPRQHRQGSPGPLARRALGLALAGLLALAAAGPALANPAAEFPVATDAKLEQAGDIVRLSMTLSRPVTIGTSVVAGPDRVMIDLPSVNFQIAPNSLRKSAGFVSAHRYGLFTADKSRIILDLAQPALVTRAEVKPVRGGFGELVVELRRATRAEFQEAANASKSRPAPPEPVEKALKPPGETRQLVVIDPGHGGIDPGTLVAAVSEKAVVLAFGLALREQLEASGRYRVAMTRSDDTFVPLGERVKIARNAGADLFISIHADSLTRAQQVRGATIYTGSERATDAESARLAAKENEADAVAGLDSSEDVQDVSGILMDLTKRETRTFSSLFARNLVEKLGGSVTLHKVPMRQAGFRVLTAPDVPSVLIELGYMSSPKDVELLNSPQWRNQAAQSVAGAVDSFFAGNRVAGKAAANQR